MAMRIMWAVPAVAGFWLVIGAAAKCPADEETPAPNGVMPWHVPEQGNPEIRATQDRFYRVVERQARFLLPMVHPWKEDPELKLLTESKSQEHFIRPNTAALEGFAFLYRFGPYDEKVVGVSRKELFEGTVLPMMRYLATTHVTGTRPTSDKKKWGDHWQSAYWAQMLGRAAWWTWDDLPEDLRESVRRIVAHEADRFVNKTPPHQLVRDTKAEENAWNSMIFNAAIVLLPSDPRRAEWEKAFQRWAVSGFLRPADEHSSTLVDGRPLSEQFTGANIYDDFTLENHGRVHPDYMGAFIFPLGCSLEYAMTGRKPPEALSYHARDIYENLKWFFLPDGGCVYPNGEDWELFNSADWPDVHIQMAVYAGDPDAWSLIRDCVATVDKILASRPEGGFHVPEEMVYPGTPQLFIEGVTRYWLMLQWAKEIVDQPAPRLGVKRLDSGKIILNRTPRAVHTVSWGPVVMAQCVPMRLDRVVSPDQQDGIGHVRLVKEKEAQKVKLHSAGVSQSADSFTADLTVDHGQAVRAELEFRSNADGRFVMREKLTALRDCTTSEIATGMIGILNNPKWVYEKHSRRIQFGDQAVDVAAMSGKVVKGEGARRIDVDGALSIEAAGPLQAWYVGTKEIEGGRATDALYLNYLDGERNWKAGQVISMYEATVRPVGQH